MADLQIGDAEIVGNAQYKRRRGYGLKVGEGSYACKDVFMNYILT